MGCPSVEELDKQYWARWRRKHKKRQFYNVRKLIVEELRRRAVAKRGYNANIAAVIEEIETEQKRSGASLAKISRIFRKEKKQRE